jgi:CHAT domain-containing protein
MANRVGLVTLAACRTGQHATLPGEEASGFVRSFLEMGARNVVASHWAVSDRSASRWMRTFYEVYFDGATPARAVRHAAISIREEYPSAYHWAAFSLYGAG